MYLPRHFEETKTEELHRIIRKYPLGTLVANGPDGLTANHLPFELDTHSGGCGHLFAHVARANPLWKELENGQEILVIFHGADAYISPNWYPSKHEFHRQVPTWNYQVVHVHGRVKVRDDEAFVRGVVARLTRTHEARSEVDTPWKLTDSSRQYIDEMLAAVVGIEVEITKLTGKYKLSQDEEKTDRISAAVELQKRGEQVISKAMLDTVEKR